MTTWERVKYEFMKGDSAVRKLIFINLCVFLFTLLIAGFEHLFTLDQGALSNYLVLPDHIGKALFRPWTLVTNIFVHSGFMHLLSNMLLLYYIGRILEDFVSNRKIYTIFLGGALLGSLLFLITYSISSSLTASGLVGASGGVTAIVVAAAFHIPSYVLRPFNLFNVEMRWVGLFFVVFLNLMTFSNGQNYGGLLAHLGGAIFGALFIFREQGKLQLPEFKKKHKPQMKTVILDETKRKRRSDNRPDQEQIDAILDKISQSGYNSLSQEEKQVLFNASE